MICLEGNRYTRAIPAIHDGRSGVPSADGVPHRSLQEAAARSSWPRGRSLARRTWPACLRQHLRGGVEVVGRAHEDDPQRVPPDALAEGGAATRRQAHGGVLLRRRGRTAAWLRAAAREAVGSRQEAGSRRQGAAVAYRLSAIGYRFASSGFAISNASCRCASRTAFSASAGVSPLAKMNPR